MKPAPWKTKLDGHLKIPSAISLAVTFGLLAAGVLFSLWKTRQGGALNPPAR